MVYVLNQDLTLCIFVFTLTLCIILFTNSAHVIGYVSKCSKFNFCFEFLSPVSVTETLCLCDEDSPAVKSTFSPAAETGSDVKASAYSDSLCSSVEEGARE